MTHSAVKDRVKANFNKAHKTYDQSCLIQNRICEETLTLLLKYIHTLHLSPKFGVIADFGCGTGLSTRKLLHHIQCKICYGVDLAIGLLNIAIEKDKTKETTCSEHLETFFIVADIDQLPLQANSIDLIFSNMALQWMPHLLCSLQHIHEHLKPNGIIAFSLPINDNFPELHSNFKLKVPHHEFITNTLNFLGYEVLCTSINILIESFPSQLEAIRSLKKVGANHHSQDQNLKMSKNCTIGLSKATIHKAFVDPTLSQLSYEIGIYVARKKII